MTTKFEINQQIVTKDHGEITLYHRSDHKNPRWQARIRINGESKQKRLSTKTTDYVKALMIATEFYEALAENFRAIGSLDSRSLEDVAQSWLFHLEKSSVAKNVVDEFRSRLFNYPVRFWGTTNVARIRERDLQQFITWRKNNGLKKKNPSAATIKRDLVPLKQLFDYAWGEGYMPEKLSFKKLAVENKSRPAFLENEWLTLVDKLDDWVNKLKQPNNKRHYRDRIYLKYYVLILGLTGIRPGTEASSISWSSMRQERFEHADTLAWVIEVRGKTGMRTVIADVALNNYVHDLKHFRKKELKEMKKSLDKNEPIFCHENGQPILCFRSGFSSFLKEYKLLKNEHGESRVPYSLRHTYATRMINNRRNHWDIARNMGTSVQMLEKTYVKGNYKITAESLIEAKDNREAEKIHVIGATLPSKLPTVRPSYVSLSPVD